MHKDGKGNARYYTIVGQALIRLDPSRFSTRDIGRDMRVPVWQVLRIQRGEPVVQRRSQRGPTSHERSSPSRYLGAGPAYIGVLMN